MESNEDTIQQWGCISNLMDKISEQSVRLDWDELNEECVNVFDYSQNETDQSKIFFEAYQFLFRLSQRVKHMDAKSDFNVVYKANYLYNHELTDFIRIVNYDFKTFLWIRKKGFSELLNNNYVDIPANSLSDGELSSFEKKIKK